MWGKNDSAGITWGKSVLLWGVNAVVFPKLCYTKIKILYITVISPFGVYFAMICTCVFFCTSWGMSVVLRGNPPSNVIIVTQKCSRTCWQSCKYSRIGAYCFLVSFFLSLFFLSYRIVFCAFFCVLFYASSTDW